MSVTSIGIRREDKHEWERRVPIAPTAAAKLAATDGLSVVVQPSTIRVFGDEEYAAAGARVDEDLSACQVVFAVKEIPVDLLRSGGAYVFFSHTIKGQKQNMPMLRRLVELGCTLIDYERIVDEGGRRLVFFGPHAGLAGMTDALAVLGRRLASQGFDTPFAAIDLAHAYADLDALMASVHGAGEEIARSGLPAELCPFVTGFAGYGNVSRGAQRIYAELPVEQIAPGELAALSARAQPPRDRVFQVVFEEQHLVEPLAVGAPFELAEYYQHPERYRSVFAAHASHLNLLINAIYWEEKYPRLIDNELLRTWFSAGAQPRLRLVADISCDIEGAIQCTVKATTPGMPAYVYDPLSGAVVDGWDGPGLAMMTTDCLPCELPREASESFTKALEPFLLDVARARFDASFAEAGLPDPIARATIVWRGELTPSYRYLAEHL